MSDDVKLEEEWAREKAAKQEAARKPPPRKSRKGLIVALVGVVVTAAMVAIVIYAGDDAPSKATSDSPDRVHIEIRSAPRAEITVDGKSVGKTPTALQFQKSAKEVVIEATMKRHLIGHGGSKDETFVATRKVTLDQDRVIDFSIKNAKLIESTVNRPDLPEE